MKRFAIAGRAADRHRDARDLGRPVAERVRRPVRRSPAARRRRSRRCPARARRDGWRRADPRCSPATAWSRPAIRWRRRRASKSCGSGGNAIDAAVATGAVLDVTSQNDTGIGGDLFALVYVAKDKKLYALNSARLGAGRLDAGILHDEARREDACRTAASTRRPCPARSPATTRC